ncbi:hypothetical protein EV421DRAFT_1773077 [Armillaria borealis]|uniref:F-box domain-containing protein n=1 Tax=Armillaria borealis TaxID=47425 RepID=A0AA39JZH0_9AGAR|nr:hypothetical protein EV421DRAFT_1773077 [Armillaria borealis]
MTTRRVPRCSNCGAATPKKPRFTDAPSPFRNLIAVNGAASGPELSHYLQGVHADIFAQDETIRLAKAALEEALGEKDRLQRIADSHVGLMSAFRSFPPEVLSQIFHLAAVSRPNEQPKNITRVFNALWKIGAVCRLWRSIVLSNPSLWACFSFCTGDVLSTKLDTVLDRSREAGMSIAIQESPFYSPRDSLERVLRTSHRWKRVWIQTSAVDASPYAQIRDRLPLLEQLSLSTDYDAFQWDSFLAFENAPRLREVVLGRGISPACKRLALPWSQITSLHMNHAVEVADVRAVLSMTSNLRSLSFQHNYKRSNDWKPKSNEDIVTCTSLQSVNVHDAAFLRTVTFPAVEDIHLEIYWAFYGLEDINAWVDIVHDFLDRSGSPVKKLRLVIYETCPYYDRLLNNAFRLTHLDITVSSLSTATMLFQVLALKRNKTNVLPQLQYLKVKAAEVTQPDTFTFVEEINLGENVVDMLVSRYRVPSSSMTEIQLAYVDLPCLATLFWMHLRIRGGDAPGLQNLISTTSENGRFVISMERAARRVAKSP